jgi:C1A family cysteine protease
MPHHKAAIAGLGAAAALTGAALMYKAPSNVQLFATDRLTSEDYKFMEFVSNYGKSYGTVAEFMFRKEQFVTRHNQIEEFNADANNTHTVGHNEFSDKTYAEMKKLNGYVHKEATNYKDHDESLTAAEVDWRAKGAVTPVKNQGQCGSCWAFSSTGAIEGADFVKNGSLKSFSEQQLVSCSKQNNGCNGGLMDYAFAYVKSNPLELESSYPYTSGTGRVSSCSYSKTRGVGTVSGFTDVRQTATQLKAALSQQPVSVAIEADQFAFQAYTSGVITSGCGTNLDHGVLAVGYGTLNGQDYFLVKNSWGAGWGDQGYVRIGQNNVCGILQAASYPSA